ncbi:MAG TPA: hypothetical protein ENK18_21170 [Deltaproteobacteria bacterium]|nr:hypothetical protein [Deltaproteobacteria bacterium]
MVRIHADERATALLAPVRASLDRGLALLPDGPPVEVTVAQIEGFCQPIPGGVALSSGLEAAEIHHPDEPVGAVPPLDRWRRAAACVLEAAATAELVRRTGLEPGTDWRWVGAAVYAADVVAPELGLALPELALAIATGCPGDHPRAGVAVMRAWQHEGADPIQQVQYLLEGGVISGPEWLRLGRWVLALEGARAQLPVPVERIAPVDIPAQLRPWSWVPVSVPAHPRGGRIRIEGEGAIDEPWALGGQPLQTLAGGLQRGCSLLPEPGGPLGSWEVASAEGFGQVMGARGIVFVFRADGRLELVLADAFVGPLAAVAMADQLGTSGTCTGRWRVAGSQLLRLSEIETRSLTVHGNKDRFLMPARGFGLGEWLLALAEDVWSWQRTGDDRLILEGRMLGGQVEVRLKSTA